LPVCCHFDLSFSSLTLSKILAKKLSTLFIQHQISDYGFAEFLKILEHQAGKTGTSIQKIDRYYASSQTCHICGNQNPETKDLRVREWTCPHCGAVHARDRNAAKNILKVGASTFFGEAS